MTRKTTPKGKDNPGLDELEKKVLRLEDKELGSEEAAGLINECVKLAGDLIED